MTTPAEHARDMVAAIPGATHLHCPLRSHASHEESDCVSNAIDCVMGIDRRSARTAPSQCLRAAV